MGKQKNGFLEKCYEWEKNIVAEGRNSQQSKVQFQLIPDILILEDTDNILETEIYQIKKKICVYT